MIVKRVCIFSFLCTDRSVDHIESLASGAKQSLHGRLVLLISGNACSVSTQNVCVSCLLCHAGTQRAESDTLEPAQSLKPAEGATQKTGIKVKFKRLKKA